MKKLLIILIFALIAIQIILKYKPEMIDSPIEVNLTLKPLNA